MGHGLVHISKVIVQKFQTVTIDINLNSYLISTLEMQKIELFMLDVFKSFLEY